MAQSLVFLMSLLLMAATCHLSAEKKLPDTGQTRSFTDTEGEDSDYLINPPSYTKLDENGKELPDNAAEWIMVRDNVTGLTWEKKTNAGSLRNKANTYTWHDGNPEANGGYAGTPGDGTDTEDFINALNAANFGGFSDWRLPTVKELGGIVNSGRHKPAVHSDYFPNSMSSNYWTSTTDASNSSYAWLVHFESGLIPYGFNKSDSFYVRAVRGRQSEPSGNLVIGGNGTVTDTSTGLVWQRETSDARNWESAIVYCENLSLAEYDDWRLPNRNELQSLVDYNAHYPSIETTAFPNTAPSYYWSSTSCTSSTSRAWVVSFGYGYVHYNNKSNSHHVRAVRGGK